ncbi:aldehyde dehydrogenase family protein [Candidatus Daviesbacteria bacterium]|nr:aldehyde dehydrogenase family protein [Candidatus Daviesbacteria bacterium]
MPEGFKVPKPYNEPVKDYVPLSQGRELQKKALADAWNNPREIPMHINGKERMTKELVPVKMPHLHRRTLAWRAKSDKFDVEDAIKAALWSKQYTMPDFKFEDRVNIVLTAADLLTSDKYRYKMNAATMLGQSMTIRESEIDAVCELADFWRYNTKFAEQIYNEQPLSTKGMMNSTDHRPLEGFVWALTPFNFTSIGGNLPVAPLITGNTVVWKPSYQQVASAELTMEILNKAGLPPGAINLIYPSGPDAAGVILNHPDFAGLHFTGSTEVFNGIWETVGRNVKKGVYKNYPRLVGEVGGKDFIVVHESVKEMDDYAQVVATAVVRGSFERQGQKCSASSRIYLPKTLRKPLEEAILGFTSQIKTGSPWDFANFMCAVIDEAAYDRITGYINRANLSNDAKILWEGGRHSKEEGYYVYPTIIEALHPYYESMEQEIFGPAPTIYYYPEKMAWEEVLKLVDSTSPYGLTGSVFYTDRLAWIKALDILENAAGNLYGRNKPTGAMVRFQPFGGARRSGTCDKAGGPDNLRRWVLARTISETTDPPTSPWYPHMG